MHQQAPRAAKAAKAAEPTTLTITATSAQS
jgi:hypothetical protein